MRAPIAALISLLLPLLAHAQPRTVVPLGSNGKRIALVVGNDNYRSLQRLNNAVRDAQAVKKQLEVANFQVILLADATREQLDEGVNSFIARIQPKDVALFYYSGHAVQIGGENYLSPIDLVAANEVQVRNRSFKAGEVVEEMESRGADLQIVVLDACRDNPFAKDRAIGGSGGLAAMNAGRGTFVAFATAPGKTADDNSNGQNGLYTNFLVKALEQSSGLTLEQVFKQVSGDVQQASSGRQVPWVASSMQGDFYFRGGAAATSGSSPALGAAPDPAREAWDMAHGSKSRPMLETFLQEFPKSEHAGAARVELAGLPAGPGPALQPAETPDVKDEVKQAIAAFNAKDYVKAVPLFRQAASASDMQAVYYLGWMSQNGYGLSQDYSAAMRYYRQAADAGYRTGMYQVGWLYASGKGVAADQAEAYRWYRKSADAGYDDAMYRLGYMYERGEGVPQSNKEALNWYRQAADAGSRDGMYEVGWFYERGLGVTMDPAEAMKWYRKAADAGDPDGMYAVGWLYSAGQGVAKDTAVAMEWYRKAADAGQARAMYEIAWNLQNPSGATHDYVQALQWYGKAADAGNSSAMNQVGWFYHEALGVPMDYEQARTWFRKAADGGNSAGMYNLAKMYEQGQGVAQDLNEAIAWYRKAAAAGDTDAPNDLKRLGGLTEVPPAPKVDTQTVYSQAVAAFKEKDYAKALPLFRQVAAANDHNAIYYLGWMSQNGLGMPPDFAAARRYYRQSADLQDSDAMYQLGRMNEDGVGAAIDFGEAARWYRQGAEAGSASSMSQLGWLYQNGSGVPTDNTEALKWYRRAADAGNGSGMNQIGWMYQNGLGVAVDYVEAMNWYRAAAETGNNKALSNVGWLYEQGLGVTADKNEAIDWYRKALAAGNEGAKSSLERLGAK